LLLQKKMEGLLILASDRINLPRGNDRCVFSFLSGGTKKDKT